MGAQVSAPTPQETLRDQVGRALYEEPGKDHDWYLLSEERREPWRMDADRIIPIVQRDYAAVAAERNRAQEDCARISRRLEAATAAIADLQNAVSQMAGASSDDD